MSSYEITAAVVTSLGVITFAAIFTILYRMFALSSIKELNTGKRDIELMDEYIYERQPSVKIRRKVWKIVKSICFWAVLAVLIPVFAFSLINKFQGNVTMVGGHAVMVVASGSMSVKNQANDYLVTNGLDNQFDTYDMIVLEEVGEEDLQLYDVIAFVDDTGKNVIHRIIGVSHDGAAVRYETRGDSNNASDSFFPSIDNVIGRYTGTRIRAVGSFVMFFQSIGGIATLLSLFYCLAMLDHYNSKMKEVEERRLGQLCGAIELGADHSNGELRAEFVEALYYKGYAYLFNDKGFIGKEEITDAAYLEKSNSAAVRVINSNGNRSESEILIKSEEGDENTP